MGYNTGEVTVKNDCTQYYFKLYSDRENNPPGSIISYTIYSNSTIFPGQSTGIHVTGNCPYQDFLRGTIKWKMKVFRVSNNECIGTLDAFASLDEGKRNIKEAVTSVDTRFMTKTTFTSVDVEITENFYDYQIEPALKNQAEIAASRAAARAEGERLAREFNRTRCRIM